MPASVDTENKGVSETKLPHGAFICPQNKPNISQAI
jgi:hypothetical protein